MGKPPDLAGYLGRVSRHGVPLLAFVVARFRRRSRLRLEYRLSVRGAAMASSSRSQSRYTRPSPLDLFHSQPGRRGRAL